MKKHLTFISYYRKEKNFNQEEMADELGITQRAYSKIENDEVQIKIDRLEQLARILEVDPATLINGGSSFNIESVTNSQIGSGKVFNRTAHSEAILYEKLIKKHEEEIAYLKTIINNLMND